jgi:hypothetical protein
MKAHESQEVRFCFYYNLWMVMLALIWWPVFYRKVLIQVNL